MSRSSFTYAVIPTTGGGLIGTGSTGYLPEWITTGSLGNSRIFDTLTGNIETTLSATQYFRVNNNTGTGISGFQLAVSGTNVATFSADAAGEIKIGSIFSDSYLTLYAGNSEAVRILKTGFFGINKQNPLSRFHVGSGDIQLDSTYGIIVSGSNTSGYVLRANGTKFVSAQLQYSDLNNVPSIPTVTGSLNYIPKFNGSNSIGNSTLLDNGTTIFGGTNLGSRSFSNSKFVITQLSFGDVESQNVGIFSEAQGTSTGNSAGLYGHGWTYPGLVAGGFSAGIIGEGRTTNSTDVSSAVGVRGYSNDTHTGGFNIGLYGNASGSGTGNYALYMAAGDIRSVVSQAWTLATATSALNIASGLFNVDTQNSRIGINNTNPLVSLHIGTNTAGQQILRLNTSGSISPAYSLFRAGVAETIIWTGPSPSAQFQIAINPASYTDAALATATKLALSTSNLDISTSGFGIKLPSSPGNADAQVIDAYDENSKVVTSGTSGWTYVTCTQYWTIVGRKVTLHTLFTGGTSSATGGATIPTPPGLTPLRIACGSATNSSGTALGNGLCVVAPTSSTTGTITTATAISSSSIDKVLTVTYETSGL